MSDGEFFSLLAPWPGYRRGGQPTTATPDVERLAFAIDYRGPDECWEWMGTRDNKGYGKAGTRLAHRLVYEFVIGPIPPGLGLDHLCRNPPCVNPAHLEPVTHRENVLRGESFAARKARQTHCIHGHAFDDANTYRNGGGWRRCRTCKNVSERRRRARRAR